MSKYFYPIIDIAHRSHTHARVQKTHNFWPEYIDAAVSANVILFLFIFIWL